MEKILREICNEKNIIKVICSNQRNKSVAYKKVVIRPILLQEEIFFQFEYHYSNKVTHENIKRETLEKNIYNLMETSFKQVNFFVENEEIQILASKVNKPRITRTSAIQKSSYLTHNKEKNYIIPNNIPCNFLVNLGVMDENGQVFKKHYSKFRQINRFLEIVDDIYKYLPERKIKILDFGCGKAYLTFALYFYLHTLKKRDVEIVGLDLKENVIDFCNKVAHDLGYNELKFQLGDIAEYESTRADLVVTLHACDTATDYALMNAVKWNAKVILSVPCCQHELFKQIKNNVHTPLLKHGIMKDKFTELLTNSLRGLKLETKGYKVSMIEFTSLEHTSKNVMIKAIRTGNGNKRAEEEYSALKDEYNVNPTIDLL